MNLSVVFVSVGVAFWLGWFIGRLQQRRHFLRMAEEAKERFR